MPLTNKSTNKSENNPFHHTHHRTKTSKKERKIEQIQDSGYMGPDLNAHEKVRAVAFLEPPIGEAASSIFNLLKLFWGAWFWVELPNLTSQVTVQSSQPRFTASIATTFIIIVTFFSHCLCTGLELPHSAVALNLLQLFSGSNERTLREREREKGEADNGDCSVDTRQDSLF